MVKEKEISIRFEIERERNKKCTLLFNFLSPEKTQSPSKTLEKAEEQSVRYKIHLSKFLPHTTRRTITLSFSLPL